MHQSAFEERLAARKGKQILVFENGTTTHRGYHVSINPHHFQTWNSILSHLTSVIRPSFGAVRQLKTRNGKHSIFSFVELKPNEKYVACGKGKYRKPQGG